MLIASPAARIALLLALVVVTAALMLVRLAAGTEPAAAPATAVSPTAGHSQGSAAAERHAYRVRHDQSVAASAR